MKMSSDEIIRELLAEAKQTLEDCGGCDHSVGICACGLIDKIDRAESYLKSLAEVDQVWNEFWAPILVKDGILDVAQVKKELYDAHFIASQVGMVYDHITGGRLSKPNYFAEDVIREADDQVTRTMTDEGIEWRRAMRDYFKDEKEHDDRCRCDYCGLVRHLVSYLKGGD